MSSRTRGYWLDAVRVGVARKTTDLQSRQLCGQSGLTWPRSANFVLTSSRSRRRAVLMNYWPTKH